MISDADKAAKSAERSRRYRERKALERKAAAAALLTARDARDGDQASDDAPPPSKGGHFSMVKSVTTAIAAMKWIQPSDGALVDMAQLYAVQIDWILSEDPGATGKAASLGQLLIRILHELGGTPTVRLQHELRSMRLTAGADPNPGDEGDDSHEGEAETAAKRRHSATVTNIARPPKRRRPA